MPSSLFYWDANVFLSYIEGPEERLDAVERLLAQAEADLIEIRTSTVSLTEVAFAQSERAAGSLNPDIEERIDDLFFDRAVVTLVEYHPLIARRARDLIRMALADGRSLKPMDAIHLATAVNEGADVLHTYDAKLHGLSAYCGGLVIEVPRVLVQGELGNESHGQVEPA